MSITRNEIQKDIYSAITEKNPEALKKAMQDTFEYNDMVNKRITKHAELKEILIPIYIQNVLAHYANSINLECLQTLIELKANIMSSYIPNKLLHNAMVHHNTELLLFLLSSGVSANICIEGSITPLLYAAIHNQPDFTELLINNKANVDTAGTLTCAERNRGANWEYENVTFTAINVAVQKNDLDTLKLLIAEKADVNTRESATGVSLSYSPKLSDVSFTPLAEALYNNNETIIDALLEAKADVLKKHALYHHSYSEKTVLELAGERCSIAVVDKILAAQKEQLLQNQLALQKSSKHWFFDHLSSKPSHSETEKKSELKYR